MPRSRADTVSRITRYRPVRWPRSGTSFLENYAVDVSRCLWHGADLCRRSPMFPSWLFLRRFIIFRELLRSRQSRVLFRALVFGPAVL